MAKKSSIGIGTLMRKKLSDITNNSDSQHNLLPLPLPAIDADIPSIQQLLTERTQLIQLIAEKDELIESSGAELRRMQADIKKLQLQNRNLAQSNSLMLAEVNLGRDKRKILQHEISCRSALIKANALKAALLLYETLQLLVLKRLKTIIEDDRGDIRLSWKHMNTKLQRICLR
ncbi:shugoshin-1-like isoform X3 [Arachis stenosperma]|uniref:shugoshin-1-like isoform X3 n=1 Tax=Arachis stenosperma TaxID=217475 RepID=UPI0025ABD481|nr:shugoshin-1-like isoform X3 [Arachis stenosperma]